MDATALPQEENDCNREVDGLGVMLAAGGVFGPADVRPVAGGSFFGGALLVVTAAAATRVDGAGSVLATGTFFLLLRLRMWMRLGCDAMHLQLSHHQKRGVRQVFQMILLVSTFKLVLLLLPMRSTLSLLLLPQPAALFRLLVHIFLLLVHMFSLPSLCGKVTWSALSHRIVSLCPLSVVPAQSSSQRNPRK